MRKALFFASSLFALSAVPSNAQAQEVADTASDEDSEGGIIVTARLREENLQEVPLSIIALDEKEIARGGLARVEDLVKVTAGLTYDIGGFPNDTRPAVRGMQAERGRPSVAVLLDGQDLSGENISIAGGTSSVNVDLFDLERIEVVKGPQATLYGRNAFAGAINYISRAPEFEWGVKGSSEFAEGGLVKGTVSVTGPIVPDFLAIRLNASVKDFDGYYRNPVNGGKLGAEHSEGFAGTLLFTPAPNIKITGRVQKTKNSISDNPTAFIFANTRLPVPGGTFTPPGPPGTPAAPCPASLTGVSATIFNACTRGTYVGEIRATQANVQMGLNPLTGLPPFGLRANTMVASAHFEWKTESFGKFVYSFGKLEDRSRVEQDGDFTSSAAPPGLVLSLQALQDLRYRNNHTDHTLYWMYNDDRFDALLGYQGFSEHSSLRNATQFWLRNPTSALGGPPFNLRRAPVANSAFPVITTRDTKYDGFFGSLSVRIVGGLRASAEVRYNKDLIDYFSSGWRRQDVSLSQLTPVCIPTLTAGATFSPTSPATSPPPGTVNACPTTGRVKESRWTPRFTLEYRWNDDILTYASYAEGFKPGGFNTNEVPTLNGQGYRSETVKTIEVGIKSSWFDDRLTANVDAYRNRYTDQQIGVQLTSIGAGGQLVTTAGILNAARVNIWGIEADLNLRIADPLTLALGYAYTNAKFDRYIQGAALGSTAAQFAACGTPSTQTASLQNLAEAGNLCGDFSGNRVGRNPKHSLNISALYDQEIGEETNLFFEASGSYRSKRFVDESNLSFLPSYWIGGLKAGVEYKTFSFTAYVDNLFDSRKIRSAQRNIDLGNPEGFAPGRGFLAYLPQPRTFGIRFGAEF
jgi:iron complex outermembrane recepter protein